MGEKRRSRINDALVVLGGVVFVTLLRLASLTVATMLVMGAVGSLFPGLSDRLIASEWSRLAASTSWCARHFLTLAVSVVALQAWLIRRSLVEAERTFTNHDLLLAGLANYLEIDDVKHPDQDRLLSLSLADQLREIARRIPLALVPFIGVAMRDHYRFKVYEAKYFRSGKPATLRGDLTSSREKHASLSG